MNCIQSNQKLDGDLCAKFPKLCTYLSLLWTQFVGLNRSKNSGEIDTKYGSEVIYFWLCNKAWAHWHLQNLIVRLYQSQILEYEFK